MEDSTWHPSLSVGNAFLDAEHKKLLSMIDNVEHAIQHQDPSALKETLKVFERAIRIHFANEAQFAATIGHDFAQHQQEHDYVLSELDLMESELIDRDGTWSESASTNYLIFLSSWASEHIQDDDMQMKTKLQAFPYDFMPAGLTSS